MKNLMFILALVIIFPWLIVSCANVNTSTTSTSSAPSAATTTPAPTTAAQYGGTLKIIFPAGQSNMGIPGKAQSVSDMIPARTAIESLLQIDPKGNISPWLATVWKYSDDFKSLTLTLRQGVKFQDDTDFNADAVKYSLDLSKKTQRTLANVSSVDVLDNYTVRINLSYYSPSLLLGLAGYGGRIHSPTNLQKLGDDAALHPVGTGPFKFVSYQRDTSIKFTKFDGYWQKGKPYLAGLEFVLIADPVTAMASFKAGEAQVIGDLASKDASDLSQTGKFTINAYPAGVEGLFLDSKKSGSPFADLKVRQAVAYAVDNKAISDSIGYGYYKPANQFIFAGYPEYNPNVVGYPFNPQKAKDLLSAAGYPKGFDSSITLLNNSFWMPFMTAVQGYLSAVSISAKQDVADDARMSVVKTGGWNGMLADGIAFGPIQDPGGTLASGICPKSTIHDPNSIWYPDGYQDKIDKIQAETDTSKWIAEIQAMHKLIVDDYCIAVPMIEHNKLVAISKQVHDLNYGQISSDVYDPENVWLSK